MAKTKKVEEPQIIIVEGNGERTNTVRRTKIGNRVKTTLEINKGVIGDSIEVTVERLMNGEGIDVIDDRDLVYNDGETGLVNPITNIRSDRMELMLEEKIGEYEHKQRRVNAVETPKEETEGEVTEE